MYDERRPCSARTLEKLQATSEAAKSLHEDLLDTIGEEGLQNGIRFSGRAHTITMFRLGLLSKNIKEKEKHYELFVNALILIGHELFRNGAYIEDLELISANFVDIGARNGFFNENALRNARGQKLVKTMTENFVISGMNLAHGRSDSNLSLFSNYVNSL